MNGNARPVLVEWSFINIQGYKFGFGYCGFIIYNISAILSWKWIFDSVYNVQWLGNYIYLY